MKEINNLVKLTILFLILMEVISLGFGRNAELNFFKKKSYKKAKLSESVYLKAAPEKVKMREKRELHHMGKILKKSPIYPMDSNELTRDQTIVAHQSGLCTPSTCLYACPRNCDSLCEPYTLNCFCSCPERQQSWISSFFNFLG